MKKEIVLVGGGGHCRSCIDVLEEEGSYAIAGIVDRRESVGSEVCGYPIIGADEDFPALLGRTKNFLITVGQIKSAAARARLFESLSALGADFPAIVSPRSRVARTARVGKGTVVMHNAIISSQARVGDNCIVNTGAIVEHDAVVGNHCHISTGAILNGECRLGEGSFLGSGAVALQGIEIAAFSIVGAGCVIRKPLGEGGVYAGFPLRRIG